MNAQLGRPVKTALFALATLTAGAALWSGADAQAMDNRCRKIKGTVILRPSSDPNCRSPVGICAGGELTGDLAGTSSFVGTSLVPTVDAASTATALLTGDNEIMVRGGSLIAKDAIVLRTTGAGEFAEVDTIVGGTGAWAGASGVFTATGTYDAVAGGEGSYEGEVCLP